MALDEDDHLPRPVGSRGSHGVAQIFSAVARRREEVTGCDGHTQIRILINRRVFALYRGVVNCLISEQKVLQDRI